MGAFERRRPLSRRSQPNVALPPWKRQESADMYTAGGSAEKAAAESLEKRVIEKYLPTQMDDEALKNLVEAAVTESGAATMQDMGKVMAMVKSRAGASAESGRIAQMVKERLNA